MSTSAALATTGCGCGSSGSSRGCAGCGGAASANPTATAFVRPRFFAGQLLTEDDLTALAGYTIAKDQLHNRYLFGAGVVCGLWVSCDPCGGGTVTVAPGYALDCCGRDLVLSCAATLDVNAMVRDLRAAQLGKDCADPCGGQGTPSSGEGGTPVTRHYRMYARYGEQEADPVAPYATGDQCGPVACEPTRIREGISFVLKCPAKAPPPDDLPTRLSACQPADDVLRRQARLKEYGEPMAAAARAAAEPAAFGQGEAEDLQSLRAALTEARSAGGRDEVRSAIGHVRQAAALVARYDLARDRPALGDLPQMRADLRAAATALADHAAAAGDDQAGWPAVDALLGQAARLGEQGPSLPRVQLAMLAQGKPLNQPLLEAIGSDAAAVKEWLLDRLDSDPALADCQLRTQVRAVPVTPKADEEEAVRVRFLGRAASELAGLFARVVQDCLCLAVNPPCAPCADADVPLACLEVADCTVVSICNAERDYVLSGSALRYWQVRGLLPEVAGCSCDCGEPSRDLLQPARADVLRAVTELAQAEPAAAESADGALARQVLALGQRVTELTEQLTDTRASLSALGGEPRPTPAKPAPRPASAGRRRPAARPPAEVPAPAEAQSPAETPAPAEAEGPAEAQGPADDPGAAETGGSDDDS